MMTLTYRANQQDEKRVEADFKAFRKRLETIGKFQYVATLERQEGYMNGNMQAQQGRSSIHVHIACQQFPACLLYTSPSPRDKRQSRMPSSA